jgi:hypothetical protein
MNDKDCIRILRRERCPEHIKINVWNSIRVGKHSSKLILLLIPSALAVVMTVMLILVFRDVPVDEVSLNGMSQNTNLVMAADTNLLIVAREKSEYLSAARELKLVFAYIGMTLVEETERSADLIVSKSMPALRGSLADTKKALYQNRLLQNH